MIPSDRFLVRQFNNALSWEWEDRPLLGWLFEPITELMLPTLDREFDRGREPVEAFAFHTGTFFLLYLDIYAVDDLIDDLIEALA